jgi:membrane protein required for beta-lactamase induction
MESGYAAAARDLYRIMIWLPARLVVLGFALAGSFVDTVSMWKSFTDIWRIDSEGLLIESGLGAISHEPHTEEGEGTPDVEGVAQIMALIKRTLLVWLAALALLTLTGWVF